MPCLGYPFIFDRFPYTPLSTPLVYDEAYSVQQQIALIVAYLKNIELDALTKDELNTVIDQLEAALSALSDRIDSIEDNIVTRYDNGLHWSIVHGNFQPAVDGVRDLYNDVTIHSLTLAELDEQLPDLTVEQLANCGLNCKGLSIWSCALLDPGTYIPADCLWDGSTIDKLTVSELAHGVVDDDLYFKSGL